MGVGWCLRGLEDLGKFGRHCCVWLVVGLNLTERIRYLRPVKEGSTFYMEAEVVERLAVKYRIYR